MPLLQRIASPAILLYSAHLPDHRGKWRVVNALLRGARMDDLHRGHEVTARRRGLTWRLDTACWVQRTVFYTGQWDEEELRLVLSLLPADGVFLDVGAYFGWYALNVAHSRPHARVLAFEPVPASQDHLEENRVRNGLTNVRLVRAAVGAEPGEAEMALPPPTNGGSAHLSMEGAGGHVRVPVTTLDAFAAEERLPRIDMVKIDVEGAELEVLRGAEGVLRRFRPLLLVELNPSALRRRGAEPNALLDALAALGYETWEVGRRGRLFPFAVADLARPELRRGYVNLFCRAAPAQEDAA
jgi:FkbM family methyltransferase